jgi:ribonuclease HII
MLPDFSYEKKFSSEGFARIAGCDEVGRGPLAGPVVAAICILRDQAVEGVKDSKKLSKGQISAVFERLTTHPKVSYGIGFASPEEIDQINIRQASLLAMRRALESLPAEPDLILVDGRDIFTKEIPSIPIIKGDLVCMSIAAASIIAKFTRDELMRKIHSEYPMYQFNEHFGYPTKAHLNSLREWGPCKIHRTTFSPVRLEIERKAKEALCCEV